MKSDPRKVLRKARLKEMAQLVIHLGISPADYWALRVDERDALIAEFNRIQKKR